MDRKARVSFGGITKEVVLACLPEAKVGDYVNVHAGFAISRVDEEEANKIFEAYGEMHGLEEFKKLKRISKGKP